MQLYERITQYLHDIIDQAYADESEEQRAKYKKFRLYLLRDEKARSSGDYNMQTHTIRIYNMSLGTSHIAKCCLHELSHHIDTIQHGRSGHQEPFYKAYTKLMYAALDMGILKPEDFTNDHWSSDGNKVRKIVEHYVPRPIKYKPNFATICRVSGGYEQRAFLRKNGYTWNAIEQYWEKEIEDEQEERELLKAHGLTDITFDTPSMKIEPIIYITASGKTYDVKDLLKELGFHWVKEEKVYRLKTTAEKADGILAEAKKHPELRYITFKKG